MPVRQPEPDHSFARADLSLDQTVEMVSLFKPACLDQNRTGVPGEKHGRDGKIFIDQLEGNTSILKRKLQSALRGLEGAGSLEMKDKQVRISSTADSEQQQIVKTPPGFCDNSEHKHPRIEVDPAVGARHEFA